MTGGDLVVRCLAAQGIKHVFGIPGALNGGLYDALLAREVLDAEQVRRLAAGLPIDEPKPVAARAPVTQDEDEARPRQKERPQIVPALNKPLPQE